ncbi:hypothetical protein HU200_028263 [Digitaria exilis]|uniref:BI1-like protein n=1 Tax=Digitaria exilis TaxID=1010633 RepID=A0A835C6B1_9POAL|nr:hypothetical protein HU200_028263 [Digitaria exilis]
MLHMGPFVSSSLTDPKNKIETLSPKEKKNDLTGPGVVDVDPLELCARAPDGDGPQTANPTRLRGRQPGAPPPLPGPRDPPRNHRNNPKPGGPAAWAQERCQAARLCFSLSKPFHAAAHPFVLHCPEADERVPLNSASSSSPPPPHRTTRSAVLASARPPPPPSSSRRQASPRPRRGARMSSSAAFGYQKGGDLEAGTSGGAGPQRVLYPGMQESPELRWALIRKIYIILSLQLLLTAAVAAVVVKVHAIPRFFTTTNAGLGLYIFLIILPFIGESGPRLPTLFGSIRLSGPSRLCLRREFFLVVVLPLIIGEPGLPHSILFPLGKLSQMIYGGLASLIFSGYIVYDTDNIIKRYTYDQYVWAAVSLYLDVINLFLRSALALPYALGLLCEYLTLWETSRATLLPPAISPPARFVAFLPPPHISDPDQAPATMGKGDHHHDLEAGAFRPPPPVGSGAGACPAPAYMMESPELRWAFIRKLLATAAVASVVYFLPVIRRFFAARSPESVAAFVAIIVAPIILLVPMMLLRKRHPVNLVLLALFTVAMSLAVGLGCLSRNAAPLTLVVVGLTLYTFWAARLHLPGPIPRRGVPCPHALRPRPAFVLICTQMLLPMGSAGTTVYGRVAALVFSGFIIYDTGNLIKHHGYDEYVTAAISLYLDTVNIFMAMLTCLSSSDP